MGRGGTSIERSLLLVLMTLSLIPPIIVGFSPISEEPDPNRGAVIPLAYTAMCVLGVTAAFYPRSCSRSLNVSRRGEGSGVNLSRSRTLLNHHSDCGGFRSHEFKLAGRSLCVGCTGMILGAATSSLLVFAYFNQGWSLRGIAHMILLLGVLLVASALTQALLLDMGRRVPRFLLNVFFVNGVSAVLIGEDALRGNLAMDSYVLALAVFWLYIRIRSSRLTHERVCANCGLICPFSSDEPES